MSVLTVPRLGTRFRRAPAPVPAVTGLGTLPATDPRSRSLRAGLAHAFTVAAQRISTSKSSDRPVHRDHPKRSRYLDDALMSREMGRL